MDQDEETEYDPELKQYKDLCFTGAHVDRLSSEKYNHTRVKKKKKERESLLSNL